MLQSGCQDPRYEGLAIVTKTRGIGLYPFGSGMILLCNAPYWCDLGHRFAKCGLIFHLLTFSNPNIWKIWKPQKKLPDILQTPILSSIHWYSLWYDQLDECSFIFILFVFPLFDDLWFCGDKPPCIQQWLSATLILNRDKIAQPPMRTSIVAILSNFSSVAQNSSQFECSSNKKEIDILPVRLRWENFLESQIEHPILKSEYVKNNDHSPALLLR